MLFAEEPTPERLVEELDKLGVAYYGLPASKYVHHIVSLARWSKGQAQGYNVYTTVDGRLQMFIDLHAPDHRNWWKEYWGERLGDKSPSWNIRFIRSEPDPRMHNYLEITCIIQSNLLPFQEVTGTATADLNASKGADSTNPVENAETSALGRALGNAGIGILPGGGKASAEEVQDAIRRSTSKEQRPPAQQQRKQTTPSSNGRKGYMATILSTLNERYPEENYGKEERASLCYSEVEEVCRLGGITLPPKHSSGGPDLREYSEGDLQKIAAGLKEEG